jgi:hypothetical protein
MTRNTVARLTVLFLAAIWSTLSAADSAGSISGVVVDESGAPIANALVTLQSPRPYLPGVDGRPVPAGPGVNSVARTGADGVFVATGLPSGKYYLCAYGVKPTQLRSCRWNQSATDLDLSPGQNVQGLRFIIVEGTLLIFHVLDPRGVIQDLADLPVVDRRLPLRGANFRIGVWAGAQYAQASLLSKQAGFREYGIAIPKNANVRLFLDTSLPVVDANGVAVGVGRPSASIAAGAGPQLQTDLKVP